MGLYLVPARLESHSEVYILLLLVVSVLLVLMPEDFSPNYLGGTSGRHEGYYSLFLFVVVFTSGLSIYWEKQDRQFI